MVFTTAGGGANQLDTGYEIENSLRFNDGDSPALSRTPSSTGNRRTFTISAWVKRCKDDNVDEGIFNSNVDSSNNRFVFGITSAGQLSIYNRTGGTTYSLASNDLLRDPSAWYHCVCIIDTTDGTEADRQRMYINGTRVTSFADNSPVTSQNAETAVNRDDTTHAIGDKQWETAHFDGYIAQHHFLDGVAYEPTFFAETNENGVWVPKEYTGGNFGTNGHFLEFKQTGTSQNSSGIGADTSGNDNHYAVTNLAATDVTTDTPTNNFCTMNPIAADPDTTLADGNLQWTSGGDGGVVGTMAVSNGKWYWECKGVDVGADSQLGIWQTSKDTGYPLNQYVGTGESWGYVTFSGKNIHSDSQSGAITVVSDNDIMMFALDMDNYKLWFGINGTWTQSGNPATGDNANHTGITDEFMTPAIASFSGTSGYDWRFNFGNPIVSISSGNSDANGYGNFEYAVPSGYYSLCTKNLAEFG